MTTSISTSSAVASESYGAASGMVATGPFPAMSARAALIARVLGIAVALALSAAIDSALLVPLAFGVAFWVGIELEVWRQQRRQPRRPSGFGIVLRFPCASGRATPRPSHPTPRAAA
jgi:hypothetical protein